MIALGTLKPHLTPEFLTAFRALGKQVGYRNLGRAIAYTKLDATSLGRTPSIAGNGDRGNLADKFQAEREAYQARCRTRAAPRAMYRHKGKRYHPMCCQLAAEQGIPAFMAHADTHFWRWPSVLRVRGWNEVSGGNEWRVKAVADALPSRKCCKHRMGLTPDYTDAHHWRYQCDKNPDHCQDIMITIGPS